MKAKNAARLAGLLYFLLTAQAPIALLYIPSHVLVQDNPAATMANVVSHEFIVRFSIVSQLTSAVLFIYLAFVLYRLFKKVNHFQAGLLVAFVLAQLITTFVFETFTFTAIRIAVGDILKSAPLDQRQNLVLLMLKIHGWGISIQEILWGLWLLPFGLLVYRSAFIPKILAYTLVFGCLCWVTDSVSFILFPTHHDALSNIIMKVSWIGEMPILFWLLIMGVKKNAPEVV
jgi:hypothetical protein